MKEREQQLQEFMHWEQATAEVTAKLAARYGAVVQSGPFRGVRLSTTKSWTGSLCPLLVGSYEAELHELVEGLIAAAPPCVINVGCAEGYYAIGMARRLPGVHVYAFDIDEQAQLLTAGAAVMNGVAEQVHVAGVCTTEVLEEILTTGALVIVDCEGCELGLLKPEDAPSLREATVLVETHDFMDPMLTSTIVTRFATTHSVRVIHAVPRKAQGYPVLDELEERERALALDEHRPTNAGPMKWAIFEPLHR